MRGKKTYEKEIIECINKNNIFTQNMIFTFYSGISRAQYFKLRLNESDYIKKALDDRKNRTKHSMLSKWYKSSNATLQLALMKLILEPEELRKLAMNYTEVEHSGEIKGKTTIVFSKGAKGKE